MAILRFIGSSCGFYDCCNPEEAWKMDSICDSYTDTVNAIAKAAMNPDANQKKELMGGLMMKTIPEWFAVMEKRIASNSSKQFIVGNKLSIADFCMAAFFFSFVYNDANPGSQGFKDILSKFNTLKAYSEGCS